MKTRTKWTMMGLIFFILVVVFVAYHYMGSSGQTVKYVSVKKGDIKQKVIVTGLIQPRYITQVKSSISGQVSKLLIHEGDLVKKSQPLLIVKPQPTPDQLATQIDVVNQAKATLLNAKSHYDRDYKLFKNKMIDADTIAKDQKDYLVAQSAYSAAKEQLELIEQGKTTIAGKLIDNRISSPVAGTVLKRSVDIGDSIVPVTQAQSGTVLFQIASLKDMIFRGDVSQIDVGKLALNMPASLQVAALPKVKLNGKVAQIAVQVTLPATDSSQGSNSADDIFSNSQTSVQNGFEIKIDHFQLPKATFFAFRVSGNRNHY